MPTVNGITFNLTARVQVRGAVEPAARHGAAEAAALLTAQGQHVHIVSEGEAHCPKGQCTPAIVAGLLAAGHRPRPHIDFPLPLT
ncbi:hypothetical protein [Streptomyces graminilatus]|uniref:hypothetical protein n=1 Tax=Streptomyces graminilatus TaxID=1464070 RepID=UPI0006E31EE9|nr:hypothetical protein [Streptomyces graminilatus]